MRSELSTTLGDCASFEDRWRDLAEVRGNAFIGPEWARSAITHLGGSAPRILSVWDMDDLVGVVPLVRGPGRRAALRFAGAEMGDRFSPAAAEDDDRLVFEQATRALADQQEHPLLILDRIDAANAWWDPIPSIGGRSLSAVPQREAKEPFITLGGLDWDQFLTGRSKSFRKRVRYLERSLQRDHQVRVRSLSEPAEADRDLDRFFALHDRRWEGRGGSSLARPDKRAFLRDFATSALRRGWLRLRFLEVDGEDVATFLGWRVGPRFSFYQGGFDPAWSRQSVGMLLVALTIRDAIAEGAGEFDFLLGSEDYKWRFAGEYRTVHSVSLVGSHRPLRLGLAAEAWARRHGSAIRNPRVRKIVKLLPTSRR